MFFHMVALFHIHVKLKVVFKIKLHLFFHIMLIFTHLFHITFHSIKIFTLYFKHEFKCFIAISNNEKTIETRGPPGPSVLLFSSCLSSQ